MRAETNGLWLSRAAYVGFRFSIALVGVATSVGCSSAPKVPALPPFEGPVPTVDPMQDLTDWDLHEMIDRAVAEIEGCQNVMMTSRADSAASGGSADRIAVRVEGLADRTVSADGRTRVDVGGAQLKLERRLRRSARFEWSRKAKPAIYGYFETVRGGGDAPSLLSIALNLELSGIGASACRARAEIKKSCEKTTRRGFCAPVPSQS